jgi:hypothetical protein
MKGRKAFIIFRPHIGLIIGHEKMEMTDHNKKYKEMIAFRSGIFFYS